MSHTLNNSKPYVNASLAIPGSAIAVEEVNPLAVNADGSFVIAFAVGAASKSESKPGLLADHITEFDILEDLINLSQIDANSTLAGNQAFAWIDTAAFSGVAGQLRYEVIRGNAHITGDINGDTLADFGIVLNNVAGLPGTGDFLIL